MKYAIVLHGPEAVDTGLAKKVMGFLSNEGEIEVVMSGYTGVAAIIDAGLEGQVDISRMRKPSQELVRLCKDNDVLLLVNFAKNRESCLSFGSIVHSKCEDRIDKALLQIDNGILIDWNEKDRGTARNLAQKLGLELIQGCLIRRYTGSAEARRIHGVIPGESIWVDGVVIGRATSSRVILSKSLDGRLEAEGVELKVTGVDRLGSFDLHMAHVRSGLTRRTTARARAIGSRKEGVFLIDHSAEKAIYRCREASLVVTVGDDTSKIAGSLLYRFNIPIVAITDGDEDGISEEDLRTEGSVVIRVRAGTDDIVGHQVKQEVFLGQNRLEGIETPMKMVEKVIRIAGDNLEWYKVQE